MGNSSNATLRPLERKDFSLVVDWINALHVARWWDGSVDIDAIRLKFEPRVSGDEPTRVFVIQVDDCPIGIIQCYRHQDYPDWECAVGVKNWRD